MNASIQRFSQHPLRTSLEALHDAILRLKIEKSPGEDGVVKAESSEQQRSSLARLIWIARFVSSSISRSRGLMWTPTSLNSANSAVAALTTAIDQYDVSKSVVHFEAACDTALDQLRTATIICFNAPASRLKKSCRGVKSNFLSFLAFCILVQESEPTNPAGRIWRQKRFLVSPRTETFSVSDSQPKADIK